MTLDFIKSKAFETAKKLAAKSDIEIGDTVRDISIYNGKLTILSYNKGDFGDMYETSFPVYLIGKKDIEDFVDDFKKSSKILPYAKGIAKTLKLLNSARNSNAANDLTNFTKDKISKVTKIIDGEKQVEKQSWKDILNKFKEDK